MKAVYYASSDKEVQAGDQVFVVSHNVTCTVLSLLPDSDAVEMESWNPGKPNFLVHPADIGAFVKEAPLHGPRGFVLDALNQVVEQEEEGPT